jgi:glyoxylase-like metal-dependent hydrolase (beta-lactamase superfamily II)
VVAGFSTHPHWDHLLWHPRLGDAPRHATARCAAFARDRLSGPDVPARLAAVIPADILGEVPLDLLGHLTGLPAGAARVPWDGPEVRVVEHAAHAPGHAALLVEGAGVLVAGDLLSDVLVPMLDLSGAGDPVEDHLAALRLVEDAIGEVEVLVPGHGSVCSADEARTRLDRDRAYLRALREGSDPDDPRIGPSAERGWEWVGEVHAGQARRSHGP